MSASKEKQHRKKQIAEGTDKRTAAKAAEKAKRRKTTITYTIVAVCLVLFFSFIFIYNSSLPSRHMTAVSINGEDYTVAQANYYYSTAYMNFYNTYSSYMNYGMFFDPNQSLADQEYSEGTSWRDYFKDTATQNMAQIQMLYNEAEAAGFTLTEEQQSEYDEEMESLSSNWSDLGYSSLQQFINLNYGKGVTLEMIKEETYRSLVASLYAESIRDSYEYTVEELDSHYTDEADQLDVIDYTYYTIPAPSDESDTAEETEAAEETDAAAEEPDAAEGTDSDAAEETDADAEETTADAEETTEPSGESAAEEADVQAIIEQVDGTDEETFAAVIAENFDGAEATTTSLPGNSLLEDYSAFLLDSTRQSGDATYAEAEDGTVYLVMFLGRDHNDYVMPAFRHILIQAEDTDGDGTFSEEELQAAHEEAQSIYDEWNEGDATEDSFAELANERSEDTGSNTTGGLYENVSKGQMVEPIDLWLYEEGRKAGDTTILDYDGSESGSYSGTHVLYFTGFSELTYAESLADSELRTEAYNNWYDEHIEGYDPVTSHMGMVGKNH